MFTLTRTAVIVAAVALAGCGADTADTLRDASTTEAPTTTEAPASTTTTSTTTTSTTTTSTTVAPTTTTRPPPPTNTQPPPAVMSPAQRYAALSAVVDEQMDMPLMPFAEVADINADATCPDFALPIYWTGFTEGGVLELPAEQATLAAASQLGYAIAVCPGQGQVIADAVYWGSPVTDGIDKALQGVAEMMTRHLDRTDPR